MKTLNWIAAAALVAGTAAGCGSRSQSTSSNAAIKTPWGDPDLQGIWTMEFDTPLQRPARFKDRATLTDQERADLDKQRAALQGRDKRVERGTELDVAGAYSAVVNTVKRTGPRTALVM